MNHIEDPRRKSLVSEVARVDELILEMRAAEKPPYTAIAALSRQRVKLAEDLARFDAASRPWNPESP